MWDNNQMHVKSVAAASARLDGVHKQLLQWRGAEISSSDGDAAPLWASCRRKEEEELVATGGWWQHLPRLGRSEQPASALLGASAQRRQWRQCARSRADLFLWKF